MLTERPGRHDVAETVARLTAAATDGGMTVFAQIDHAGGARAAGLELADMVVVLVGTPSAGTRLIQRDARLGLDLPLRILVWDDDGTTRIAFRAPADAVPEAERESVSSVLTAMTAALERVVAAAA